MANCAFLKNRDRIYRTTGSAFEAQRCHGQRESVHIDDHGIDAAATRVCSVMKLRVPSSSSSRIADLVEELIKFYFGWKYSLL
jgi:hypothetical protein